MRFVPRGVFKPLLSMVTTRAQLHWLRIPCTMAVPSTSISNTIGCEDKSVTAMLTSNTSRQINRSLTVSPKPFAGTSSNPSVPYLASNHSHRQSPAAPQAFRCPWRSLMQPAIPELPSQSYLRTTPQIPDVARKRPRITNRYPKP